MHTSTRTHDTYIWAGRDLAEGKEERARPERLIRHAAKVRQGLFRRPRLFFYARKRVGEGDDELAVALALVLGQGEDAGEVVVVGRLLLLGEVAHDVEALAAARGTRVRHMLILVYGNTFVRTRLSRSKTTRGQGYRERAWVGIGRLL